MVDLLRAKPEVTGWERIGDGVYTSHDWIHESGEAQRQSSLSTIERVGVEGRAAEVMSEIEYGNALAPPARSPSGHNCVCSLVLSALPCGLDNYSFRSESIILTISLSTWPVAACFFDSVSRKAD